MPGYSPLLAIVTGVFEFAAAILAFSSPGRKRYLTPVGLILLLLAGYQFAEVAVCSAPENLLFTRLAFFDITWLPLAGMWLMFVLIAPKGKGLKVMLLAYGAAAAGLVAWIFAVPGSITQSVCQLVIARYSHSSAFEIAYGVYYQSALAVVIFGSAAGMARVHDPVIRKNLANLQAGVLGFVLPSLAVRILVPAPEGLLPSVMCHFALVLAVSLCAVVLRERRFGRPPAA